MIQKPDIMGHSGEKKVPYVRFNVRSFLRAFELLLPIPVAWSICATRPKPVKIKDFQAYAGFDSYATVESKAGFKITLQVD